MFTNIDDAVSNNIISNTEFCFSPQNDFHWGGGGVQHFFRARRFGFPSARPAKK